MATRDSLLELQNQIRKTVLGQEAMIERLLIGLLANGNLLVEGLPGLAKTRAIKKLSKFLDAGLSRIQFTPDLAPLRYHGLGGLLQCRRQRGVSFSARPCFQQPGPLPTKSTGLQQKCKPHCSKPWKSEQSPSRARLMHCRDYSS